MPSTTLWELEIHWDDKVYEPSHDSVMLAEGASAEPGMACLDMCTGCGLSALILARDAGAAVAVDVNPEACRTARENAERNDLWLDVACMDLAEGLDAPFDVITCNPPYLPTGPDDEFSGIVNRAVSGGKDGAVISRRALDEIAALLAPGGTAHMLVSSRQPVAELHERANELGLDWRVEQERAMGGFERLARVRLTWADDADDADGAERQAA